MLKATLTSEIAIFLLMYLQVIFEDILKIDNVGIGFILPCVCLDNLPINSIPFFENETLVTEAMILFCIVNFRKPCFVCAGISLGQTRFWRKWEFLPLFGNYSAEGKLLFLNMILPAAGSDLLVLMCIT